MKISMGYPSQRDELDILTRNEQSVNAKTLSPVISCDDISELAEAANSIRCADNLREYIIKLVDATRNSDHIKLGVSPRGSIALYRASKAYAMVSGRDYVIPDDIKVLAPYVLAHRIMLTPKGRSALGSSEKAIAQILETVSVPVQ